MPRLKDLECIIISLGFFLVLVVALVFWDLYRIGIAVYISTFYCIFIISYLYSQTRSYFSPVSIFIGFFWLMLIGRPLLFSMKLVNEELIQASEYNIDTAHLVDLYVAITINAIGLCFFLLKKIVESYLNKFRFPEVDLKQVNILGVLLFLLSGVLMLKDGINGFTALSQSNYIDLIESGEIYFFNPIYYTILKWSWFFLFVTYTNRSKSISFLFLFFLCSLPLAGMRGYFIIYVLMILMLLEAKKLIKINMLFLMSFLFGLLSLMTFLLEYRLGFSVGGEGVMSPFFNAIFSQGATYEVLYGSIEHFGDISFIKNVLFPSLYDFPSFGNYIDALRGVNSGSNDIGFATSAFAELISGGIFVWGAYIILVSVSLVILNFAFQNTAGSGYIFVLFFMSPVVWGQPRGSMIQFIVKFLFFILLLFFLNLFRNVKIKLF